VSKKDYKFIRPIFSRVTNFLEVKKSEPLDSFAVRASHECQHGLQLASDHEAFHRFTIHASHELQ
jgi:hypothetical protein